MKILQINAVCDRGSTGRICRELNDVLVALGHEGIVLYGNGHSDYELAYKVSGNIGVKMHGFLSRLLGRNAAYSPFATKRLLGFLRSWQPDIVHLHNLHGNYVNLKPLLRYLAKERIPTVLTLHDCWFFTGKCSHYTTTGCRRWQTGCHHCPQLKEDIPSWFFDRTAEMWAEKKSLFGAIPELAVIGVSDWITGEAGKSFLKETAILQRIYNWIDCSVFYPRGKAAAFGISEEKYSILCVSARWHRGSCKTRDLLEMARILPENYEIILAGAVPWADRLPGNIRPVGYISSAEELAKLYSACDVYVHLSREETFGKVIGEALACGTPAVVYNTTACPEILGEGCGSAVAAGDPEALLKAVESILRQPREDVEKRCTEHVRMLFDRERLINDTVSLYDRLMKKEAYHEVPG